MGEARLGEGARRLGIYVYILPGSYLRNSVPLYDRTWALIPAVDKTINLDLDGVYSG